jgi:hypothetical protein
MTSGADLNGTTTLRTPSSASGAIHPVLALAVWVPQLAALILAAAVMVAWLVAADTFWPLPEMTLSEAVVTRDYAEVVRLIENGADPNRASHIRADMLNSAEYTKTPLEAAVGTGVIELVQLLLRHGATMPAGAARASLICESVRVEAEDVTELLLATGDGSDPRAECAAIPE